MTGSSPADRGIAVLAGGKGVRLKGVLRDRPKPMAEVAGRPFLEWLLLYLRSLGFARFTLCTGYLAGTVEGHFGDGSRLGAEIRYSRELSPQGTAGALRGALDLLGEGGFFALNGDSLCAFDPEAMAAAHVPGALATMWLVEAADARRYGSAVLGGDGVVSGFCEKRSMEGGGLVNAGIYLIEPSLLRSFPPGGPLSLERDVLPGLPRGALRGVAGRGPLLDIGTPESLASAAGFVTERPWMFAPRGRDRG